MKNICNFKRLCLCAMLVALMMLCGCKSEETADSGKLKIVCTTFPQYDWVREIAGDNIDSIELILLGNGGIDLHSYQATAEDIITISDCDVFIHIGGVSDQWVDEVLKQATNEDMIVINMMEVLEGKLLEEELVEGMEEEEHKHNHEDEHLEELIEYDEHVWLSLHNAIIICESISDVLMDLDEENASLYESNCKSYISSLEALDEEYENAVNEAKYNTLLFGDRFPFVYMVEDYGINYYAAFVGCSSESEASFETIAFLADKLDELKLPAILVVDGSTMDLANTVVGATAGKDYPVLILDSLQATSKEDIEKGKTYLGTMEDNLLILKQALGVK